MWVKNHKLQFSKQEQNLDVNFVQNMRFKTLLLQDCPPLGTCYFQTSPKSLGADDLVTSS